MDKYIEQTNTFSQTMEKSIPLMSSDDYKDRLKAEYIQVTNRLNKLQKYLSDWKNAKLAKDKKFKPACPYYLLQWQLSTMREYQSILKYRSGIEGVDLK